jgi:hypothetical protein
VRKSDLTAICERIVWKMWEIRRLTILRAPTACYKDNLNFLLKFYCGVEWPGREDKRSLVSGVEIKNP